MYTVSARKTELNYLRLLLHYLRAVTSYIDTGTVNAEEFANFREACQQRALLIYYVKWKNTLREGFRSSYFLLTKLFATLLVQFFSSNTGKIYNKTLSNFRQYFHHRRGRNNFVGFQSDQNVKTYHLLEVEENLQKRTI